MSDYTNTFGGAAKDIANATILGAQFDTQFDNIATAVATKADKYTTGNTGDLLSRDANGNLTSSAIWNVNSGHLVAATDNVEIQLGNVLSNDGAPVFRISENDDSGADQADSWIGRNLEMVAGAWQVGRTGDGTAAISFKTENNRGELYLWAGNSDQTAGDAFDPHVEVALLGGATPSMTFEFEAAQTLVLSGTNMDVNTTINVQNDATFQADLVLEESADHSGTPAAGDGRVWVRNDAPNTLMFTDDAGTDFPVGGAAADEVNAGTFVYKASDETVSNSTVLQGDDDLVIALDASSFYRVEMFAWVNSDASNDFKWSLVEADGSWAGVRTFDFFGGVPIAHVDDSTGSITQATQGTADDVVHVILTIATGGSGGNFQFQWAQNAASGNTTTVKAGSWMSARKLN